MASEFDLGIGNCKVAGPFVEGRIAAQTTPPSQQDPRGSAELRERFVDQLRKRAGLTIKPSEVVAFGGRSSDVIGLILQLIGLRVAPTGVVWTPCWFGYPIVAEIGRLRELFLASVEPQTFQPNPILVEAVNAPIGAVVLNDFRNPLGTALRAEHAHAVAEAVLDRREGTVLLEDAHYFWNQFREFPFTSILRRAPELWERNRYLGVCSLRLAFNQDRQPTTFVWGPEALLQDLLAMAEADRYIMTPGAHATALACLGPAGDSYLQRVSAGVRENLLTLKQFIADTGSLRLVSEVEGGTNAFLDISNVQVFDPASDLLAYMFRRIGLQPATPDVRFCSAAQAAGVTVIPGGMFHWPQNRPAVRINLAAVPPKDFKEAMSRLGTVTFM